MRTVAVTGAASGIGAATRARLEAAGVRVIGVDLDRTEVAADLSSAGGRATAIDGVARLADGRLDGVVACAGLGPQVEPRASIASVNYFGAVATLDGLRPLLAAGRHPAAVAISSNSATISPAADGPIAAACLAGDERDACRLAADLPGPTVYAAAKLALARWVRRTAVGAEWAGRGIRLNAVAPGATLTPLLQAGLDDERLGDAIRALPIPLGGLGRPEQIAAAVCFLLGEDAAFCCGSILFVDGGSDALIKPERV
jgi:NAD(P)-dependent dehydrogenase (short-subunit alcohol dehydrogenase family)